jgi:hypothetical protein
MVTVHRVNLFAFGLVLLVCRSISVIGAQQPDEIDLTPPENAATQLLSAPGYSSGVPRFSLPVEITLQEIDCRDNGPCRVRLSIYNQGTEEVLLPRSRDLSETLRTGNKKRSMMLLRISSTDPNTQQQEIRTVLSLAGSDSIPGSVYVLKPRKQVRLVFDADLAFLRSWHGSPNDTPQVRLVCLEWLLDDSSFFISKTSEDITSTNQVKLTLH